MPYEQILHVLVILLLPPLLQGVINRTKAWWAGRQGAPLLQPYYDLWRLVRKGSVFSPTTTWVFRAAPVINFAAVALAALMVPLVGDDTPVSFTGDLIFFAYALGLARFFNKQQDNVTEKYDEKCVLGTADYLAPEQAVSNIVDVRADIYSLGGTLYFMLTGQVPFPDGTIAAKLVAHQREEPRPVEEFRSDVPDGVLDVLRRMMAKNPAHRYQEPMEVAEALAEWAEAPVDPPPDREMPSLCPLVRALAAPPGPEQPNGTGTNPSLVRVLFDPGRGVFSRVTGSSAEMRQSRAGSNPRAKLNAPANGPVSTSRTNTAPTAPLPPRQADAPPVRRRPLLIVAIAVAVALLFVGSLVVAYQLGKGNREPGPATSAIRTT